jgi:predicted MarR family transcription regulator
MQSKKLRSVPNIVEAARDFAHLASTVSPSSAEFHYDIYGALCDAIKSCRATKATVQEALMTAIELAAGLDHDITMASKPVIHYEQFLLRACILLKDL